MRNKKFCRATQIFLILSILFCWREEDIYLSKDFSFRRIRSATTPDKVNFKFKFGRKGTEDGQFNYPDGVAINPSTGEIIVVDVVNARVQVFDSQGGFKFKFGGEGEGDGQFNSPFGIAINPSTGEIIVSDGWNHRVQVFGPVLP